MRTDRLQVRVNEKQVRELAEGAVVARSINNSEGTDYEATLPKAEPADVDLVSKSGEFTTRPAQVVTIPFDFTVRDDNKNVLYVRSSLADALTGMGMKHLLVGIVPSRELERRGVTKEIVARLAELIVAEGSTNNCHLQYQWLLERDAEVAERFHQVLVSHHPEIIEGIQVDIPTGGALPPDGQWIAEGIHKKAERYGGTKAVENLALIIGVAGFVDDRQVGAFMKSAHQEELPFAEIWINTPFHGTVCLKKRQ